jgi:hypothetical protein
MTRLIAEAIAMVGVFVLMGVLWIVTPDGRMASDDATALSSASPIEPASPSRRFAHQSHFAGE